MDNIMKISCSPMAFFAWVLIASTVTSTGHSAPLSELEFKDPGLKACIQAWALEDFNQYQNVEDVKELGCSHYEIKSLEGIEVFEELLAIDLSHNPIEDYAPLHALGRNLSFVWLWDNSIRCEDLKVMRKKLPRAWIGGANFDTCLD